MKQVTNIATIGLLLIGIGACSSVDKTSSSAPNVNSNASPTASGSPASGTGSSMSSPSGGSSPSSTTATTKDNQGDATSKIRRDQLNSDIRAREQRNNITGGDANRAKSDLSSEVRSKLEANLPKGNLTVAVAKDGEVVVSGTVTTQAQLDKISPLAKQVKGVKSVKVAAKVAPAG